MTKIFFGNRYLYLSAALISALLLSACGGSSSSSRDTDTDQAELIEPWTATAIAATWLDTNPYQDKHDGGWVYSEREDRIYAIYGNENSGQTLHRIDHIGEASEIATTFNFGRHGAHPVVDDSGTYIYMPPSQNTNQLERYNTETDTLEILAAASQSGTFAHGAWKNGKLWIVLNDNNLYSYDPVADEWSVALHNFGSRANVAGSGTDSSLIHVLVEGGNFVSYDTSDGTLTDLESHPHGFDLGGNAQLTWFGERDGFIYAASATGEDDAPAMYDIAEETWHDLDDPKLSGNYGGHATYDSSRQRLYLVGSGNTAWYYQF